MTRCSAFRRRLSRWDGRSVEGQAVVEIRPNVLEHTRLLANRLHRPYPVKDPDSLDARLLVRDWEDGPETEVPRSSYRFAREVDGRVMPSLEHVYFEPGFKPGKIYRIVYPADRAVVVGAGLLAVRDTAVWLRHPSALNPVDAGFERAYAYGVSQTGRMLRHFLYLGLNVDEHGRKVYDGLLPHVAGGRRGEFNHRFRPAFTAVGDRLRPPLFPSRTSRWRTRSLSVPMACCSGSGGWARCRRWSTPTHPPEYWRGDGGLAHH